MHKSKFSVHTPRFLLSSINIICNLIYIYIQFAISAVSEILKCDGNLDCGSSGS